MGALANIGQREKAIISMVMVVLLAFGWYWFVTKPIQDRAPLIQAEIDQLTIQRDQGRAAQAALPQLRAAIAQLESERQQFLRELPPTEQLGRVLTSLTQQARQNGVTLRTLTRAAGDTQGVTAVRATNLALAIESPWSNFYLFLRQLESLQRFSLISGLNLTLGSTGGLTGNQTSNPAINSSLTMTVYTYTGERASDASTGAGQATPPAGGQTPPQPAQPAQPGGRP
jgi:type IV pilus assembly protein PilO